MGLAGEPAEVWKMESSAEEGGLDDDERAENEARNEAAAEMRKSEEAFWSSFITSPQPVSEQVPGLLQNLFHTSFVTSSIMSLHAALLVHWMDSASQGS